MAIGARPIGTRSLGDSAPAGAGILPPLVPPSAGEVFAAVSFAAAGTLAPTATRSAFAAAAFTAAGTVAPTATRVVAWASVRFTGAGRLTPTIVPRGRRRRAVVTDVAGTPFGELENATIGSITFELNEAERFSIALPIDDPKADLLLDEKFREVQVWRGDQLLAWGPAVRPAVDTDNLAVTCRGALWHLTRRHIGKAERTNYVNNGDFEAGLARWGFGTNPVKIAYNDPGAQPTPPHHSIVSFPTVTGRRALRLSNYVTGADAFATQSFLWTVDETTNPDGDLWTLKGYVYVESFTGPATEGGRGLYLERFSTVDLNPDPRVQAIQPGAKKSIEHVFVPIDEDTPRGVWQRFEVGFRTPPKAGEPENVNVRLYAPNGVVYWDAISLSLEERTAFFAADQTSEIAAELVGHLQDPAYGKSDVNISPACPPSGKLRDRIYVHSEHPNGYDALEEFAGLDDGFDFAVRYTPTDRLFSTFYPARGVHWPRFALELGRNIGDFAWTFEGEGASSSIVVLGQGDGSDREEGAAIDPGAFAGGLTLEEVFSAPPETPIDSLDNIAAERLTVSTAPEVLAIKTTRPTGAQADPIGVLWPGDTVPVRIRRGPLELDDTYRVIRLTVNPDDTLDLVLNLRSVEP